MEKNKEEELLEKIAKEYFKNDDTMDVDKRVVEVISDYILKEMKKFKNKGNIIEMGVGENIWTKKIIKEYGHTTIIDASDTLLNYSRENFKDKVTCIKSFFEDYNSEIKFDQVLCSYVLEHVENPIKVLSAVKKWIHNDSIIHILVPHADSLHRRIAVAMELQEKTNELGESDKRVGHRRVYTTQELFTDIRKAGLETIESQGLFLKMVPNSLMKDYNIDLLKGILETSLQLPIEYCGVLYYKAKLK